MTNRCHHCLEYARSLLVHRAAAEAGRGLPEIELGEFPGLGKGLDGEGSYFPRINVVGRPLGDRRGK